ncbi:MAG TPA: hypothetical protein VKG38_04365 [Solirubrobacteraceae bacterium]|nr:hypothetical protein [Solirubrobacteraceae bacterium]
MNILRRLPLSRVLLLCGLVVAIGVSATAIASAVGSGPTPAQKPLAQAVHDALGAEAVQGVSASITYTNHLLEGANLASGGTGGGGGQVGELASSPLLSGASGRLWATKDRVRLELQSEKGDTEVVYDGHTISIYDAATNTIYRYTPKEGGSQANGTSSHEAPSLAKIEEAIADLRKHVDVSEATPTDVAGQPAYTVRVSPKEAGSLIGGAELSFDAVHGMPLRTAIYSSTSSSPVIELAATEVSYGPVESSVFELTPPANAKIDELGESGEGPSKPAGPEGGSQPKLTTHGSGVTGIAVLESQVKPGSKSSPPEGLPQVDINGATASELRTALGTILTFERSGVRYVVAGALDSGTIEAFAKGL